MSNTHRSVRAMTGATLTSLTLLLAACGNSGGVGGAGDAAQESAKPGETTTISYETWYPDEGTLKKAIAGFEKDNPTIKVKLRVLASQDFQKQLPLQLNGRESLDVVGVQVSAMTNTVGPQLRPVADWEANLDSGWRSKLDPKLLDQTAAQSKDKKLLSIPMGGVASAFMYYNQDILAKAGLTPPKTIDELAAAVKKIQDSDPAVTTPVAYTGEAWWQEEMLFSFAGQKDPKLSDSLFRGSASWNQTAVVQALKDYKSAIDSGAVSTDTLSLKGSDPTGLFYSGKAAFLMGGSWEATVMSSAFRKANGVSVSNIGVAPIPLAGSGTPAVRSLAEGGLAIPRASKHVKEAAKFIAYMTYGAGVDLWNENLAYIPFAKVGWTPPADILTTDSARAGVATIASLSNAAGSVRDSQQDFLNNVEGPTILKVLRGDTTPESAAGELQSAWTSGRFPRGDK